MPYKFGKLAPKRNAKTLCFARYLLADAPPAPPTKSYWEYLVKDYPMMKNDSVGDCTCACIGHLIQLWTAHTGKMVVPTDDEVLAVYSAVTGYDPVTGDNDNGAAITDVLNYFQQLGMAGHKIDGWASITASNQTQVEQGVFIFGGVDIGFMVPQSAMDQFDARQPWTPVENDGGIVGGHSVPVVGYGSVGCTCVTWGQLQQMTWPFFMTYVDEAYLPLSLDWVNSSGVAPNMLNVQQLVQDLKALAS